LHEVNKAIKKACKESTRTRTKLQVEEVENGSILDCFKLSLLDEYKLSLSHSLSFTLNSRDREEGSKEQNL